MTQLPYRIKPGARSWVRVLGARWRHQRRLERATLFQDRDYPVLNDYRAVLGGLFRTLWGLQPGQSERVFPQVDPVDLRLA